MVAWTARSSPNPLRKRSVTRSSSSTEPDSIGSVDARVVKVPSTASRNSRISANSSGLGWLMYLWIRFCSRPVSLSSSARILSDSRTCRTSSHAEPRICAPLQIMPASTTTTSEFSPAIDRIRQRIGTERTRPTMPTRPRVARLAGRSAVSSCRAVTRANSLYLANSRDQCRRSRTELRLCIDSGHRGLECLAVEVADDGDAGRFRLAARLLLEVFPFFAHEPARLLRGFAKQLSLLG